MFAWHVHHKRLYEVLEGGGIEERRSYIRTQKPFKERSRRLRLLVPVKYQELLKNLDDAVISAKVVWTGQGKHPVRIAILKAINALHAEECKKCPWDGKTIFPERK